MKSWAVRFLITGISSFILPRFGLQFKLVQIFGGTGNVSLIFIAVGAILLLLAPENEKSAPLVKKITYSLGGVVAMLVFATVFTAAMDRKKAETARLDVSPSDLYTHCFKFQTSSACQELADYYQKTGDQKSANISWARGCALGDEFSCQDRSGTFRPPNEFQDRTIASGRMPSSK